MYTKGIGYAIEMLLRPQTLYGISDSPAGLAAWMLDHDALSYDDIIPAFLEGTPVGNLTRDEILDNVTLTWLTNTGISSARLYAENVLGFFDVKGVTIRSRRASSPGSSTRPRAAGPRRPTPTSSTTTRSPGDATSPRGRSPSSSSMRSVRASGRCASDGGYMAAGWLDSRATRPPFWVGLSERPERRANLAREELRLFPRGEVAARSASLKYVSVG